MTITHVRYINILTWLREFQDKRLYWCCFLCRQRKLQKFTIWTRKPRSHVRILIHRAWRIVSAMLVSLSLVALIVYAHPYCARKLTGHVMHACAR